MFEAQHKITVTKHRAMGLIVFCCVMLTAPVFADAQDDPSTAALENNAVEFIVHDAEQRPPAGLGLGALLDNPEWLETQRPRLAVALGDNGPDSSFSLLPYSALDAEQIENASPAVSWSLEAWQLNTASLAHIQCSSASRTLESFLVENCRFVDQPTPSDAVNLVQVEGRWMAAPGLQLGLGAFTGQQSMASETTFGIMPVNLPAVGPMLDSSDMVDDVEGLSMNLSFGLHVGRIGDLMLDLELSRYRRSPDSLTFSNGMMDAGLSNGIVSGLYALQSQYQTAGQLGLGWRKNQFSADLVGQYRELPYWFGPEARGEGFNSFDIEFSWRAPINSSISVGITNVLDARPDAASLGDRAMENSMDSIYGRIPYVRYKHDL